MSYLIVERIRQMRWYYNIHISLPHSRQLYLYQRNKNFLYIWWENSMDNSSVVFVLEIWTNSTISAVKIFIKISHKKCTSIYMTQVIFTLLNLWNSRPRWPKSSIPNNFSQKNEQFFSGLKSVFYLHVYEYHHLMHRTRCPNGPHIATRNACCALVPTSSFWRRSNEHEYDGIKCVGKGYDHMFFASSNGLSTLCAAPI